MRNRNDGARERVLAICPDAYSVARHDLPGATLYQIVSGNGEVIAGGMSEQLAWGAADRIFGEAPP